MHDTTRKLTLFLLFLPSEKYATNPNGINNIEYVFVELSLGYGMKYVTEFILLGQATEIRSRVISRLVCAILPTWRNARLKPYARYYPPLPYVSHADVISVSYKDKHDKGTSLMTSQWRTRPLRHDWVTLHLNNDLGRIKGIVGILKLRKRFRMWQTSFEHGINSSPFVCFRGYEDLSTLSIAILRLAFGRAWYCDAKCG